MSKSLYDHCIEREDFLLLVQWDKENNGGLTPKDISYGSHRKVWWQCQFGHRWQAAVYTRSGGGAGCPYCTGKKLLPTWRTLATEYPHLVKQWHPTKNAGLRPEDLPPATHRRVWWRCEAGHEWQARVNSRTGGTGCPVCTNRRVEEGENDLATTHPEIAEQWHPEKNGTLTPNKVVAGNGSRVWWRCGHGHEWQATVRSRTADHIGCPICAGKQVVPGENDLASMFPQLAHQWHPTRNGRVTPEGVTAYSNRRVWWRCEVGHEYQATIAQRARSVSDCPYCTNRRVLAGFNDLETKEPRIAQQWHPELNGALTPQMVTPGSKKKVWWQCEQGHVWKAVVYSRAGVQKCGCPVCAGKVKEPSRQSAAQKDLVKGET